MKANQLRCCEQLPSTNSHPCCLHPAAVIQLQCFRAGLAEITLCTQGPQAKAPPPELSSARSWELCSLQQQESPHWNATIHFGSTYLPHKSRVLDSILIFPGRKSSGAVELERSLCFFTQPATPICSLFSSLSFCGAESSPLTLRHVSDSTGLSR